MNQVLIFYTKIYTIYLKSSSSSSTNFCSFTLRRLHFKNSHLVIGQIKICRWEADFRLVILFHDRKSRGAKGKGKRSDTRAENSETRRFGRRRRCNVEKLSCYKGPLVHEIEIIRIVSNKHEIHLESGTNLPVCFSTGKMIEPHTFATFFIDWIQFREDNLKFSIFCWFTSIIEVFHYWQLSLYKILFKMMSIHLFQEFITHAPLNKQTNKW